MTEPRTPAGVDASPPSDPDALREEIEETRASSATPWRHWRQLDVKAQAKEAVSDAKDKATTTLSSVQSSAAARADQFRDTAVNTYQSRPQVAWAVVAAVADHRRDRVGGAAKSSR